MAQVNYLDLGTTRNPNGGKAARAGAAQKTPYDKMLSNFDEQLAMFNAGRKPESRMGQSKAWFKDNGNNSVEVCIRYAGKPLLIWPDKETGKMMPSYFVDRKNLKVFTKGLRADLEAHAFDDAIKPLDEALNKSIEQRKASRGAKK